MEKGIIEKLKDTIPIIAFVIGVIGITVSFMCHAGIALCIFAGVFASSAFLMWIFWFRKMEEDQDQA